MTLPPILIVDDKQENLYALQKILKPLEVEVIPALSGMEALRLALEHDFCLAIIDVQMPEMDGYELVELLRGNKSTATLPIIFVSAIYSDEYHYRKGYDAGAVDFMSKPFIPDILISKVRVFVDIYHQRNKLQELVQRLEEANAILSKRALQLEASSQVGRQAVGVLDLDSMLQEVVNLIQAKFGYYLVDVWLLNRAQDALVLKTSGDLGLAPQLAGDTLSLDAPRSIVIAAFQSGQSYLANDVSADALYLPVEELQATRAELALPLQVGQRKVGVLDIQSEQTGVFAPEDIPVLQTLADEIAIAIRNAQLYDAEKQRRSLAELLEETGRILSSKLDMHEIPGLILERLAIVVPYERGAIFLQQDHIMKVAAQHGFPSTEHAAELEVKIRAGDVFEQMLSSHRPVLLEDVTQVSNWQQVDWLPVNRSWLGVPLISKDRVIGMISLTRCEAGAFCQEDADLVLAFAGQAAIVLENANLYDQIKRFSQDLEQQVQQRTQELEKAYKTLEKLDKSKSDFIEVAAHELRTPLTLIKGYATLLEPLVTDLADARTLVAGIVVGQTRLHEVVNSMLDVSKIDSQMLEVCPEKTWLPDIISNIIASLQSALEERRLTLTTPGLSDLPHINADPSLLSKVFYHLIINAIKYTPDGGSITITSQTLNSLQPVPSIEVAVSDTGIGIDPVYHELIFEKFYQTGQARVHSSGRTKFKGGGPGLGLSIAKGIIQAHGGRIWVESAGYDEEKCPGSTFHVLLPIAGDPRANAGKPVS